MAYVITQPCIGVKDASCVEVCPVDCIHTDDDSDMYYIDPEECIDCGACVDPCPVDAIYPEDEVPGEWANFIQINADYFKKRWWPFLHPVPTRTWETTGCAETRGYRVSVSVSNMAIGAKRAVSREAPSLARFLGAVGQSM